MEIGTLVRMQTDLHCRLANRLGYCNRELRKQDCVRPLDGLSNQQVTTNQHWLEVVCDGWRYHRCDASRVFFLGSQEVGMQVGDLVYLHWMDFTPCFSYRHPTKWCRPVTDAR